MERFLPGRRSNWLEEGLNPSKYVVGCWLSECVGLVMKAEFDDDDDGRHSRYSCCFLWQDGYGIFSKSRFG